ncbi:MAG: polysaccharide deacetylase family protein [Acidimicrobiales bacterium]|nr:polysaccharide deacetylase family protein [Acidimicrobiales bacterium]
MVLRVFVKKTWRSTAAVVGALVLVAGCSSSHGDERSGSTTTTTRPIVTVTVVAGPVQRVVHVRDGEPLTAVLAAAKVLPIAGRLLSAVTHRPFGVSEPARMTFAGRPVTATSAVAGAGTLLIVNGTDRVEPVVTVQQPTPPPGRPAALQHVYTLGRPGVAEVTKGQVSGEVVTQRPLDPGQASVQVPGMIVSLTFDDGPNPGYTQRVLAILKAKGVHAVFCLIGVQAKIHPALVHQEIAEGHQVCNHTLTHDQHLATAPPARIDAEVAGGIRAIESVGLPAPPMYRPPAGSLSPAVYAGVAAHQEQVLFWSDDPLDWKRPPADEIVNRVMAKLRPGAIVLLHDGGGNRDNTIAALPVLIDKIRTAGYTFSFPLV